MSETPPALKKAAPAKGARAAPAVATKAVPAKLPKAAPTPKAAKVAKAPPKREKLVRDSFTIPKSEYAALAALKLRAAGLARPVKKSELLRAGLMALSALGDPAFLGALRKVPELKTGRPAAAPVAAAPATTPKVAKPKASKPKLPKPKDATSTA